MIWAIAALAAVTLNAQAQETTAPAPVPPSTCPAFVAAPSPPDGATASANDIRRAVEGFEAWRVHEQATLDCRRAEVTAINAQLSARADEYRAAQADNTTRGTAFQAQLDIYNARQPRQRR